MFHLTTRKSDLNHVSLGFNDVKIRDYWRERNREINAIKYNSGKQNLTEYLGEVKLAGVDVKKQLYDELYRQIPTLKTTYLHDKHSGKRNAHWRVYGWRSLGALLKWTLLIVRNPARG